MLKDLSLDFGCINLAQVGQTLTVGGFCHTIRDHGGLIFVDLRSQTDILQCVFDPAISQESFQQAEKLHSEYVIQATGTLVARDSSLINPNLPSGEVELRVSKLEIVSQAVPMPFDVHAENGNLAGEETRLKYRYLDLRRNKLKKMLTTKSDLILAIRNWFHKESFVDVTTPILANPSPEGARDFIVPSRLHPGHFYALPQAPQQFKQLLMVGGFNRYIQIAPCFRDEDPRSDRHPGDFYQIDAEVAWADQEDIFELNQKFATEVLPQFTNLTIPQEDIKNGFVRLSHAEAMNRFGSDKPDLRYDLEWVDVKPVFADSGFSVFADLCQDGNAKVQALVLKGFVSNFTRSDLDKIQDIGRANGLPGIAYIQYTSEGAKSPIFKFFGDEQAQESKKQDIANFLGTSEGDLVLFLANSKSELIYKAQNQMRIHIAKHLDKALPNGFIRHNELKFAWVYQFPFFEEENGKLDFAHNPFGVWQAEDGATRLETLNKHKANGTLTSMRAIQYDLTLNGFEVLSGGVRNSDAVTLMEAFKTVGYTEEEVKTKFRHMMEAYTYAAPPHAGFAWGLDRLFMILTGEANIREVIAFPKNGQAVDAMTGSPLPVDNKNLRELSLKLSV